MCSVLITGIVFFCNFAFRKPNRRPMTMGKCHYLQSLCMQKCSFGNLVAKMTTCSEITNIEFLVKMFTFAAKL